MKDSRALILQVAEKGVASGIRRALLPTLLLLLLLAAPTCAFAQNCGGAHQRACCLAEASFGACQQFDTDGKTPLIEVHASGGCPISDDPLFQGGCGCGNSIFNAITSCEPLTPCGGPGQRACCNGNGEFSNDGLACNSGDVQIGGCDTSTGNCFCASGFFESSGTCVQPTPCGGKGQRACCAALTEYANGGTACDSGLVEVPGCAGDCTCGGSTATGQVSSTSCTTIESIAEPATSSTPAAQESTTPWQIPQSSSLPTGPECPATGLCGYADLHVHMFTEFAHGGAGVGGQAWNAAGVNAALAEDYGSNLNLVDKNGNAEPKVDGSGLPECPDFLRNSPLGNLCSGQVLFHGDHTAFDSLVGGGSNDGAASNLGAPLFNGWPLWSSTIHQQVYWKWLERAWLGGLRLMVMDAVSNETFCKTNPHRSDADCTLPMATPGRSLSFTSIDAQLQAAYNFQNWLDTQYGGTGNGWYRIVTTPAQATAAIQQGKLAVVLGIEVDNLFDCHYGADTSGGPLNGEGPTCSQAYVLQQLQKYYAMGVRHIFPIHDFDNAYGNTATWSDSLNVGNRAEQGRYWDAVNCTGSGYGFDLSGSLTALEGLLGFGFTDSPNYPTFTSGSCHNAPGLTTLGQYLVQQAMALGMIVDVDHMSIDAFNDTISLAQTQKYPGIAATHVLPFDLYQQQYTGRFGRHERMRTLPQLQSIAALGGMISLITKDDVQDTGNGWCRPGGNCPFGASGPPSEGGKYTVNYGGLNNNCRYSTTQWAQAYNYAADKMGAPVGIGSDFNGVAGHVGPRFGSDACGGDGTERSAQEKANKRLVYPFTIAGFGTFSPQVTGQRTFDFNTSGLAHIGLLPDMIADLRNVGLTDAQLQPLFGSAQAYINMWTNSLPPPQQPNITSANSATLTVGQAGSFQVTATGNPAPTYSELGTLPQGVTLDPTSGLLSGTPAPGSGGAYAITLRATNGVVIPAIQSFTLTVNEAPTITSANSTIFKPGALSQFVVTTTGFPVPTFSETGSLPTGIILNAQGYLVGTTTVSGTYNITITATNGIGTNATQNFTLTMGTPPVITSPASASFRVVMGGTFTVTATGTPAPTFSESGALPSGTYLGTNGVLIGVPPPGSGGVYPITITASNGVLPAATQSFTLYVQELGPYVDAAITSSPAGVSVTVSGGPNCFPGTYTTPASILWITRSSCTVSFGDGQTISGANYVFTASTVNGTAISHENPLSVNSGTVAGAAININATYSKIVSQGSGQTTHFAVNTASNAVAGVPLTFAVLPETYLGIPDGTYSDPLHFTSTDPSAILPADTTLTSVVGLFSASFNAPGSYTVTVTDPFNNAITGTSDTITVSAPTGLRFIPVTPCRVADTRTTNGPFGGPFIGASTSRSFTIPNSSCGIPSTAQAYSFNVTAVPHGSLGYITIWPAGNTQPVVSTLNSVDGRIKANAAIVPAGTSGGISVFATNDTDLILDVDGYFVPASNTSALAFYPVTPCRLVDTRTNLLTTGGLTAATRRTLPLLSSTCNVPSTAKAYSLNFTAVPPGPLGYLSVWPTGQSQPLVSTLNDLTGTIVGNAAIVPAGTSGSIDVYATNATDLVVDINGYFAPAGTGGLSLYGLPPCRVLDTRNPSGSPAFTGSLDINVIGSGCGGTSAAQGYVLNTTVVPSGLLGYVSLWPQGAAQPVVSTLNALDGAITNNMAIVPTTNTEISAFASGPNATYLILDISAYFAP